MIVVMLGPDGERIERHQLRYARVGGYRYPGNIYSSPSQIRS